MAISANDFIKDSDKETNNNNNTNKNAWKKDVVSSSVFSSSATASPLKGKLLSGSGSGNDLLVDYNKSEVYHTEPIFIVGNEQMYGYENYKQYDQYTGHALNIQPNFKVTGNKNSASNSNSNSNSTKPKYYVVEENGKKMTSGKTYYLGFQTVMVPYSKAGTAQT